MKLRSKTRLNPHFSAFLTVFLAVALILTACNSPMGLGKPVDTLAPTVVIDTPADNEFIRGILLGSPVIVSGYVFDDLSGPDKLTLSFEMHNKTAGRSVKPDNIVWEIDEDGRWRAEITITATEGAEDYTIKVFAQDAFKNRGSAIVNVRLDIVPPWIRDAQIARHPGSGFNFSSALYPLGHYIADGYMAEGAYRNIPYLKIDEYQNEVFTVRLEIEPSYADVAASRLYVKSQDDAYLHEEGLAPSGYWRGEGLAALRYPEWNISASQIIGWDDSYASGASYLLFEVWAYSEAAWDKGNDRPFPGEPGRVQRIGGTVWLPESDKPHAMINPEVFVNDIIVLERSADSTLAVDFYDDDRLGIIYTKLLPKLELLALCGGLTEEEYLNSLTDPKDPQGRRAALISKLQLTNSLVQSSGDGRFQRVDVSTAGLELGEYRLIALARDDKSKTGYSFESGAPDNWGAYPPVSIQVSDINAPFVFVEKPERENEFPPLTAGESFEMSGFILGRMETISLNIAWVPKALQTGGGLDAAIAVLESERALALKAGETFVAPNGITIWGVELREDTVKTNLNGVDYFRVEFEKIFHIIDDFQYNGNVENLDKLLVLHAANHSTRVFSTFNMPGLYTKPDIEVTNPENRGSGHHPDNDLLLSMRVNQAAGGAAIKPGSQVITDITMNMDINSSFTGPITLNGNEWTRTVLSQYIVQNYPKGSQRVYSFRAQDILGNTQEQIREVIFTDQPLLESIACTEKTGTYGIYDPAIENYVRFEATFSMPVTVFVSSGQAARLKLYLTDPGTGTGVATTRYADYDAANSPAGKTIIFTYKVQEGDSTNLLCTSLDAIVLSGGAKITSIVGVEADLVLTNAAGLLQSNSTITLDGDRPFITRASFAPLAGYNVNGVSYYTNGKKITLKLIANETVKVNGTPYAIIRYGGSNTRHALFESKTTANGIDTLLFTYTFTDNGNPIETMTQLEWGALDWFDFTTGIAAGSSITDVAGNKIIDNGYDTSLTPDNRRGAASGSYPSERGYVKTRPPTAPTISLHPTSNDANNGTNAMGSSVRGRNTIYLRVTGKEYPDAYGVGGTDLYYSLQGGNGSESVTVTGTNPYGTAPVPDTNNANRHLPSYEKSQYVVTAWRVDRAGNRSDQAANREVTLNSRWPELTSIEISLPDGDYPLNTAIPFRLNFSDKIRSRSGGSGTMSCQIYATYEAIPGSPQSGVIVQNYTIPNMALEGGAAESNTLTFNWTPTSVPGTFYNIKLNSITFGTPTNSRFEDLYGNPLVAYSGSNPETLTNTNRDIGTDHTVYSFQLNRPLVKFHINGPLPTSSNPIMGGRFYVAGSAGTFNARDGAELNGNALTSTPQAPGSFTMTYDVPITKVSGKYIYVRPYGNWAVPIILTVEEMDGLLNHSAIKNNTEYTRRLTDVDRNDSPNYGIGDQYNYYTRTTHGIVQKGDRARPDTTTKWVLNFYIDPHGTDTRATRLREVLEAADWKVQKIHVGSQQVTVNDKTATITLSEALLPGRIWEVRPDPGAFIDAAGNPSGRGYAASYFNYRFWSADTAAPVIRVNRRSYGDLRDNESISAGELADIQPPPNIDTEVRIDCETPGADIHYNVIRTRIQLNAAATTMTTYDALPPYHTTNNFQANGVFCWNGPEAIDDLRFFFTDASFSPFTPSIQNSPAGAADGYYRVPMIYDRTEYWFDEENGENRVGKYYGEWDGTLPLPPPSNNSNMPKEVVQVAHTDGYTTGYARNTIGNDDYTDPNNKSNGFLKKLLFPNTVQTGPSEDLYGTNGNNTGALSYAALTTLGTGVTGSWTNSATSKVYRTVGTNGMVTHGSIDSVIDSNGYFFIGEAWGTFSKLPTNGSHADPRLYTGRRDYIVASARKNAVSSGNEGFQGPSLGSTSSGVAMEGVYKTVVIFREPFGLLNGLDYGLRALRLGGVSDIPVSTVSGFPLKPIYPSGQEIVFYNYTPFRAYRIGGSIYAGTKLLNPGSPNVRNGIPRHSITNNFLWVSWDIVTDYFLNGYAETSRTSAITPYMFNRVKDSSLTFDGQNPAGNIPAIINSDYIAATYGGIVYRYGQWFAIRTISNY